MATTRLPTASKNRPVPLFSLPYLRRPLHPGRIVFFYAFSRRLCRPALCYFLFRSAAGLVFELRRHGSDPNFLKLRGRVPRAITAACCYQESTLSLARSPLPVAGDS